jgi:hypothetical protein
VVDAFKKYPKVDLAGSSEMYLYYLDTKKIYAVGPHHQNHATNGTMAWRKTYADKHVYDEFVTKSEEGSFLDNYKHKMIQLDPKRSILVICHEDNTSDKQVIRKEHAAWKDKDAPWLMRETNNKLEDFVKEPTLRYFYQNL